MAALLPGCGSISRAGGPGTRPGSPRGSNLDPLRFDAYDRKAGLAFMDRTSLRRAALGLGRINALALSGGGANGAYGAGLLCGWSQSGRRPVFDLVTGVSAGALMAPFAFLGPAWDARLQQAFTDDEASNLLGSQLQALVQPSVYSGDPLQRLVAKYIDAPVIRAVAAGHAAGRMLLVATTDLDTQETVIWDMGAIAQAASREAGDGETAHLFRQVLVASASIPGIFPPVLIRPPNQGHAGGEEMHVDGGVTAPFFLAPEALILWRPTEAQMLPGDLYAIINGTVGPSEQITQGTFFSILWRSYDTMSKATTRAHLNASAAFAERSGGSFRYAAVPDELGADSLDFGPDQMRALFQRGLRACLSGEAFRTLGEAPVMPAPRARSMISR